MSLDHMYLLLFSILLICSIGIVWWGLREKAETSPAQSQTEPLEEAVSDQEVV
jgi:cbb3-type cytochrome oxidase subunit 3